MMMLNTGQKINNLLLSKESKEIRYQLTETCKKKLWHTSILRHICQKLSCKEEYTDQQLEFLIGWATERKRLYKIDYREENTEAITVRRSQRNKEKKEKKGFLPSRI